MPALFASSAQAELLLSPKIAEYALDGVKFKQLAFSDGAKVVTYQAPRGWEYSGTATTLSLRPPNKAQAEATMTRIALPQPGSFDEESLKKLVDEAIAQVPKGSENVSRNFPGDESDDPGQGNIPGYARLYVFRPKIWTLDPIPESRKRTDPISADLP